ncbi:hypothetical protein ACTWQL_05100 [Pseudalkalibacillus sp. R45]|uniref:hypothetical protein n=1 Tax=Pseudalkalibacillus sp. R45 TaxID=3457433 RepID=UPI003FCCC9F6
MKSKHEDLKSSLDQHVFNNNTFDKRSEKRIIEQLHKEQTKRNGSFFNFGKVYKPVLSLIALLAFASFLYFYISNGEQTNQPADPGPEETDKPPVEAPQETTSQQEIYKKMLNSAPYFNSAEGIYRIQNGEDGDPTTVKFAVNHELQSYYEHVQNNESDMEIILKDIEKLVVDHKKQTYTKSTDLDFEPEQQAYSSYLYPKELANTYLQDFETWEIKQTDDSNDQDAVVVEGKTDTEKFRLEIMKDTGVVLSFTIRENDKITQTVTTNEITIEPNLAADQFTIDIPAGYADTNAVSDEETVENDEETSTQENEGEPSNSPADESSSPASLAQELTGYKMSTFDPLYNATKKEVIEHLGKPIKDDSGTPQSDDLPWLTYEDLLIKFKGETVYVIQIKKTGELSEEELKEKLKEYQHEFEPPALYNTYSYNYDGKPFDIQFHFGSEGFQHVQLYSGAP